VRERNSEREEVIEREGVRETEIEGERESLKNPALTNLSQYL
jgi:hypothetical protein